MPIEPTWIPLRNINTNKLYRILPVWRCSMRKLSGWKRSPTRYWTRHLQETSQLFKEDHLHVDLGGSGVSCGLVLVHPTLRQENAPAPGRLSCVGCRWAPVKPVVLTSLALGSNPCACSDTYPSHMTFPCQHAASLERINIDGICQRATQNSTCTSVPAGMR